VNAHRPHVVRNENAAGIRRDLQNGWIGRAIWNNTGCASEVHRGLLAPQTPPDVWVKIRVGLRGNLQACLADLSCLTRSKRSIMSAGMGYRALILLENPLLVLQVSVNFGWVLQNERDSAYTFASEPIEG
jgi:hypothetical protein